MYKIGVYLYHRADDLRLWWIAGVVGVGVFASDDLMRSR